jgi:hypothetical protein
VAIWKASATQLEAVSCRVDWEDNIVVSVTPDLDVNALLDSIEAHYVKYQSLRLKNGISLVVDRNIRWRDNRGLARAPSADLHSGRLADAYDTDVLWAAEVKGGADPAGSDEHWKTASRALSRIIEAAKDTGRSQPPLSFFGTTIVAKVAVEIRAWIDRGDLASAHNLSKIIERPKYRQRFIEEMLGILGYNQDSA